MLEIVLTSNAPHFSQEHALYGKHYIFEFQWLEREKYWLMHLYDAIEKPLALGLKVMPDWPIYVDNIAFFFIQKNIALSSSFSSLQSDFRLMAYELI